MPLPYPAPTAIRTTKRCKFSLPGRKYNCRCVGNYELEVPEGMDGQPVVKGYCAPHYDTKWKFYNPEHGPRHVWVWEVKALGRERVEFCWICGNCRVHDGLPVSPCRGRVTLRFW